MASTPAWRAGATSTRRFATGAANTPATRTGMAFARCTSTPSRGSGPCCAPGSARTGGSRRRNCRSISAFSNACTTHAVAAKPCLAHSSPPWSYDPAQHPGRQQEPHGISQHTQGVIGDGENRQALNHLVENQLEAGPPVHRSEHKTVLFLHRDVDPGAQEV